MGNSGTHWHLNFNDHVGFCMTMYDYVWSCTTMCDYIGLCMIMYDYVWLCMTMCDYV